MITITLHKRYQKSDLSNLPRGPPWEEDLQELMEHYNEKLDYIDTLLKFSFIFILKLVTNDCGF